MADGGPADRLRSPKKDDGERVRQTSWDEKKLARSTKPQQKYTRWEKNQTHIPPHVHNWLLCTTCVELPLGRVPALAHEAAAGRDAVEVAIPRKGSEALDAWADMLQ
jgi:hypothetical protein